MLRSLLVAAMPPLILLTSACGVFEADATPTSAPAPSATRGPATPTPFPTFTPTPTLGAGSAIVVGGEVRTRVAPTTQSAEAGKLDDLAPVQIGATVQGENVLVGSQRWVSTSPPWASAWYQLQDGRFIYAPFVFILQPGEVSPLADPMGQEKWIDVNVATQTASAMIGGRPVYTALVSTGSPDFPSPLGSHTIQEDGRLAVERMTSSQAGYNPAQASYDVERVLFTQYYDRSGDALHMNYWRPPGVFGRTATSHGCVGMQMHEAQYFWVFAAPGMRVEIHG